MTFEVGNKVWLKSKLNEKKKQQLPYVGSWVGGGRKGWADDDGEDDGEDDCEDVGDDGDNRMYFTCALNPE